MATTDVNLAERSGNLVESHKGYDPRIIFFYFVVAVLLLTLAGGLAYQQLLKTSVHSERERKQNERRVIVPGPRGNIYDREGRLLVGNRPVFSVVLYVDELRAELRREQIRIRKNYREMDDKDMPSRSQLEQIARVSVTQQYLDRVIRILDRDPASPEAKIDPRKISRHFSSTLVLPYTLLDDLSPEDYARLLEALPVNSPLQVYTSSSRSYPYKAAAAHTLGYVRVKEEDTIPDLPGDDLKTFKMKGATGEGGLEKQFDDVLQGTPGGSIFRVDPSGFRINPPIAELKPRQGKNLTTSLDIDLQVLAETLIGDQIGAVVAMDVRTGEVLALVSKPDYGDLNEFSPRATNEVVKRINETEAWNHLAISGLFPPGSTFKMLVAIAGLRAGRLTPHDTSIFCNGTTFIGRARKTCHNGHGNHGNPDLADSLARSCDTYYYHHGIAMGPRLIAAEARRMHLDQPTGIELPAETKRMLIPDPDWLRKARDLPWTDGYTANIAIGQGDVLQTPLQVAAFTASLARGEIFTQPTLLHDPNRPTQRHESLGLTREQYAEIIRGMVGCTTYGTAKSMTTSPLYQIPGVKVAGKTGTSQKDVYKDGQHLGIINFAWFTGFAPADNPQIAVTVMMKGDTIGEDYGGGANASPVAALVMKKYFEKKAQAAKSAAAPTMPTFASAAH